jgi:poly(ADP-ribose) glycohydrolase ARH3
MESRFVGTMLGLALGDALGAPHEGGWIERTAWKLIARGSLRYTDDTEMALVLAESLLVHGGVDQDALAAAWAERCRWSRGYGPGARRLLRLVARGTHWRNANRRVFPDGSFGNGAAMRIAPLALYHARRDGLDAAVVAASEITHAHPLGIEGARLVAQAILRALRDETPLDVTSEVPEYADRLERARAGADARELGNSVRAHESVVTALCLAQRIPTFPELMERVIATGGDTDTIGAMAGAVWGARHGAGRLPDLPVEDRARIEAVARRLHAG